MPNNERLNPYSEQRLQQLERSTERLQQIIRMRKPGEMPPLVLLRNELRIILKRAFAIWLRLKLRGVFKRGNFN